jgi:hypothetical protein
LSNAGPDGKERRSVFHKTWPVHKAGAVARLRVVRQGARFSMYAAEGEAGEFRLLDAVEVSGARVEMVRFAADPGWISPIEGVDVRLLDFAMSAQEFVGYPADRPGRSPR